jgi:uncharacterized membrane protein (Fun14 family)
MIDGSMMSFDIVGYAVLKPRKVDILIAGTTYISLKVLEEQLADLVHHGVDSRRRP